jgi:riboflavin synthase
VVEASAETAARTTVGGYRTGSRVNLERALKVGDRLGGHIVTGHVDEVGTVSSVRTVGRSLELAVGFDRARDRLVIEKGSVALNGVSLTVNRVRSGWLSVNVIPHTAAETTIRDLREGDGINVEFDCVGKYILRSQGMHSGAPLTVKKLRESGW